MSIKTTAYLLALGIAALPSTGLAQRESPETFAKTAAALVPKMAAACKKHERWTSPDGVQVFCDYGIANIEFTGLVGTPNAKYRHTLVFSSPKYLPTAIEYGKSVFGPLVFEGVEYRLTSPITYTFFANRQRHIDQEMQTKQNYENACRSEHRSCGAPEEWMQGIAMIKTGLSNMTLANIKAVEALKLFVR